MGNRSMKPTNTDKKINKNSKPSGNLPSELDALVQTLRETGVMTIVTMDKNAQTTLSNWAYDLVNQYGMVLKNNPIKLKDITKLPCSKIDVKLAIKLLLMASVKKGTEEDAVNDLRNKFISLGSFQLIDQEDLRQLTMYGRSQKTTKDIDVASFPKLNKYMTLIISEQKVLLHEINSFIEDIREIKKRV